MSHQNIRRKHLGAFLDSQSFPSEPLEEEARSHCELLLID